MTSTAEAPEAEYLKKMASIAELSQPLPLWLDTRIAKHVVKGSLLPLSAQPRLIHPNEWLAHQGNNEQPADITAFTYLELIEQWIASRLDDTEVFPVHLPNARSSAYSSEPTDRSSSPTDFPREFKDICRVIFTQMFRAYAHLNWNHFAAFYHLSLEKELNSCFSHFVLTATSLRVLEPEDLAPMQSLLDLWALDGTFPPESYVYTLANLEQGKALQAMSLSQDSAGQPA